MKQIKITLLLFMILTITNSVFGQDNTKKNILSSIGNAGKWNSVNFILFSSTSNNSIFKERSFLIDKSSGRVRFDGTTTDNSSLVLLFNYKTNTLSKSYLNGKLIEGKSPAVPFQEVINQLFEDSKLLFLPMFIITAHKNNIVINPEKMVNSEKLVEINFKNLPNLNKHLINGILYLNTKGEIKEYFVDQSTVSVSDIKDVGDGIMLPTRFSSKNTAAFNVTFSTVAAFTDIEDSKFLNL